MTLTAAAETARKENPAQNVIPFRWQDEQYWLKQAAPKKSRKLQYFTMRAAAALLRQPILTPARMAGDAKTIGRQAARISAWRAAGFSAPAIVLTGDGFFVSEDHGNILHDILKNEGQAATLLPRALDALLAAHERGMVHGRPMLKDMTETEDGKIGFLDFEEDPLDVMPFPAAAARDLIIFLGDAAGRTRDETIRRLVADALGRSPQKTVAEMHSVARFIRPLLRLSDKWQLPLGREIGNIRKLSKFM